MNFFTRIKKRHTPGKSRTSRGMTLAEILVALGIFSAIVLLTTFFERDVFSLNQYIQEDLDAQIEGRRAVTSMVGEMREMSPSSLGAYPIAAAATSTITFYSDIDADSVKEQIRYYIQSNKLFKSVINPTGNPLVYNSGSAVVTTVSTGVLNSTSTPLFQYYDGTYTGTTSPLTIPVDVSAIKLVKINMILERKSSKSTQPLTFTSQVTIRNLKDNL